MTTLFGYKPDPTVGIDENGNEFDWLAKDLDFTTNLKPSLVMADGDVDLSSFTTETNQFGLSSCAGNATADSIELLNAIREATLAVSEKRSPRPTIQVSRLFIYALARGMMDDDGDGQGDIDKDEGTYIRNCFEVLSRFGVCDENIWAYDESKVYTAPSIKAMRQAVGHRIHSYYRIRETGDDRLEAIKSALQAKHPVVFGTLVDQDFLRRLGPSVVDYPRGATVGGHAMMVVGYVGGDFIVKNSWSKHWRDDGFVRLTPEYLMWGNTSDLWVPTLGTQF